MKRLIVEAPNIGPKEFDWTPEIQFFFQLDRFDVKTLEEGNVVWQGDIAFELQEAESDPNRNIQQ